MIIIFLLCLTVYCTAKQPTRCDTPKQWVSRVFRDDPGKDRRTIGATSYDAINKRFRIIEEDLSKGQRDFYDTLFLYNVRKEYRLNLKTRQCNVTNLTGPFKYYELPHEAKFQFQAEIGPASKPLEHMTVQMWGGQFPQGGLFGMAVTVPDCVPVQHFETSNDTGLIFSTEFFDTALGIADPTVFIPPRECTSP